MRPSLIIIFSCILILPDLYIWLSYLRKKKAWKQILFFIPLAFVAFVQILGLYYITSPLLNRIMFFLIICLCPPKLVFSAGSIISRIVGIWQKKGRRIGERISIGLSIITLLIAIYATTIETSRIVEKEHSATFATLPKSFDGYRIVQISDLHIGSYNSRSSFVRRMVEKVNALQPDMIVFTGDMVNVKAEEVEPFRAELSKLRARDGVYAVLGNHDYGNYARYSTPDGAEQNTRKLVQLERELGWNVLEDRHVVISRGNECIAVVGVGDIGKPPFKVKGDLTKARKNLSDNIFQILLSHDPSHWRMEVLPKTDIELMLAGHTHAMQVEIGKFSPVMWLYDEWGGEYDEDGQQLYVSTGLGGSLPFRIGATPEIVVHTLHSK